MNRGPRPLTHEQLRYLTTVGWLCGRVNWRTDDQIPQTLTVYSIIDIILRAWWQPDHCSCSLPTGGVPRLALVITDDLTPPHLLVLQFCISLGLVMPVLLVNMVLVLRTWHGGTGLWRVVVGRTTQFWRSSTLLPNYSTLLLTFDYWENIGLPTQCLTLLTTWRTFQRTFL